MLHFALPLLLLLAAAPDDPLQEILDRKPTPAPSRENPKLKAFLNEQLLRTVKAGDRSEVAYCLDRGADLGVLDADGSSLVKLSLDEHEVLDLLLARGADVEAPITLERGTMRPVIYAAEEDYRALLAVLVKHKAKLEGPAETGGSALARYIGKADWQDAPGVARHGFKALVEAGADLQYKDAEGRSILDIGRETAGFPPAYLTFIEEERPREAFRAMFDKELGARKAEAKRNMDVALKDLAFLKAEQKRLQALAKKGPLHILERSMYEDDYGTKKASMKVYNAWGKTADAFSVQIRCFNNFGRPVYGYGYRQVFKGICQSELVFDELGTFSWTMWGYDTATKFSATITEVHFTDGSTWRPRRR